MELLSISIDFCSSSYYLRYAVGFLFLSSYLSFYVYYLILMASLLGRLAPLCLIPAGLFE